MPNESDTDWLDNKHLENLIRKALDMEAQQTIPPAFEPNLLELLKQK